MPLGSFACGCKSSHHRAPLVWKARPRDSPRRTAPSRSGALGRFGYTLLICDEPVCPVALPRLSSLVWCARLAGTGAASSVVDFAGDDGGGDGGDNAAAGVAVSNGARTGERENGGGG